MCGSRVVNGHRGFIDGHICNVVTPGLGDKHRLRGHPCKLIYGALRARDKPLDHRTWCSKSGPGPWVSWKILSDDNKLSSLIGLETIALSMHDRDDRSKYKSGKRFSRRFVDFTVISLLKIFSRYCPLDTQHCGLQCLVRTCLRCHHFPELYSLWVCIRKAISVSVLFLFRVTLSAPCVYFSTFTIPFIHRIPGVRIRLVAIL